MKSATGAIKFAVKETKLYFPAVSLSSQGNIKLLKQLECATLKEQVIGTNINLNWQSKHKIDI